MTFIPKQEKQDRVEKRRERVREEGRSAPAEGTGGGRLEEVGI